MRVAPSSCGHSWAWCKTGDMTEPDADGSLLLCCLLWAREGEVNGLTAYEDAVLAFVSDHGGAVLHRLRGTGDAGRPHEVQLLRFDSQSAVDSFVQDPRRLALAEERDRVVERTEVFPVKAR